MSLIGLISMSIQPCFVKSPKAQPRALDGDMIPGPANGETLRNFPLR